MKYLVLGCNGMAGHLISLYLQEQGNDVTGFAREKSKLVNTIEGDAGDAGLLLGTITKNNFDCIVNCIGLLNQEAEIKKADAVMMNAWLPHYLAYITNSSRTRIIHISTDCVFSGKNPPYCECALREGTTFYARSKALGELDDRKNVTIRTSIVGPDMKEDGIGLLNWFMRQNDSVKGYKKTLWTGVTTLELARIIDRLSVSEAAGIINAVPDCNISKLELLRLINQYIRIGKIEIIPDDSVIVDKTLVCNQKLKDQIPSYENMIKDLAVWINSHRDLYVHYWEKNDEKDTTD